MDTKQYWDIRNKSEDALKKAMVIVKKTPRYKNLAREVRRLNKKRKSQLRYFKCTYGIHSDDVQLFDFEDDFRGGYIDTIQRSQYIDGTIIPTKEGLEYPLPNKPVTSIVCFGFDNDLTLDINFAHLKCMSCESMSIKLPFGYFCERCSSNKKLIYKRGEFDCNIIATHILKLFTNKVVYFYELLLDPPEIEQEINVGVVPWDNENIDNEEQEVRIVLIQKKLIRVCEDDHEYSDDGRNCVNCDMYFPE